MRAKLRVRIVPSTAPRFESASAAMVAAVPALAALLRSQQTVAPVASERAA